MTRPATGSRRDSLHAPAAVDRGAVRAAALRGRREPVRRSMGGFVDIATTMVMFALFASGFNLLFGHVGELSFGHAMFFALGAYMTALYSKGFYVAAVRPTAAARADRQDARRAAALAVIGLAVGVVLGAPHRAALERHLLLDDHAGVRASDLLHRLSLERPDRRRGRDAEHRPAERWFASHGWLHDSFHYYIFAAVVVFLTLCAAVLDHRLAVRQRAARDPREQAARALLGL